MRDGKYAEAIRPLIRTVALGGGDGKVFGLLGFAYLSEDRYVSAETAYRQALVYRAGQPGFQVGLGEMRGADRATTTTHWRCWTN